MELHERIQEIRKVLGLSRREFGEHLGVSESVIVNIEYNRLKRPEQKEPLLKLICNEFEVNELWLRTGEGEMFNNNDSNFDALAAKISLSDREDIKELTELLWGLDVEELKAIKNIVTTFKKNSPNPKSD